MGRISGIGFAKIDPPSKNGVDTVSHPLPQLQDGTAYLPIRPT